MTTAPNAIHLLDVVRVFNDPHLPVRTTEQGQALHTFISRFMHELQTADGVALDMVVNLCRQTAAECPLLAGTPIAQHSSVAVGVSADRFHVLLPARPTRRSAVTDTGPRRRAAVAGARLPGARPGA